MIVPQEEAVSRAKELRGQGWTVFPADDFERAMRGFVAVSGEGEEDIHLEWPIFDEPLEVDSAMGTVEDMLDLAARGPVVCCDNPMALQLGFALYLPEEGRSIVRKLKLTQLKASPRGRELNELRERLLETQRAQVSEHWALLGL